jgi:hypothetical protein
MDAQKWLMTSRVLVGLKREPIFMWLPLKNAREKIQIRVVVVGAVHVCPAESEKQLSDIIINFHLSLINARA